ncbi:MAG: protein of unknown function with transrane region [Candidatus Kaiserbacteria bacterium]|nr:protein of unknown function with transrane region [Candidatus Kaiserbacteria bacterium]
MKTNSISQRTTILSTLFGVAMIVALSSYAYADTLTRQLDVGMSGSDVSSLQTFLAADSSLYPQGLVTGYFGSLTASAVSRFQTRNGLPAVGRVGPLTLGLINTQMGGTTNITSAPIISNATVSTTGQGYAIIHWQTNKPAQGTVYYSTSPLVMTENSNDVTVNGSAASTDTSLKNVQDVTISNLASNTTYYYVIYTRDANGNVQVTWPTSFKTQ